MYYSTILHSHDGDYNCIDVMVGQIKSRWFSYWEEETECMYYVIVMAQVNLFVERSVSNFSTQH